MTSRSATRLPADLRGSGWYELLPEPAPPRRLEGSHSADWVIIGAGFAGLAAARRLRQLRPGDRIAVIDAQQVAWGAAGRNSGFMIDLPHELNSASYGGENDHDRRQIRLNRLAIEFAGEAAEEYGLQNVFDRCGKYHGAATERGLRALKDFERHLAALGEAFTPLDAADMKAVTGMDFYIGGTFTPGAVMIQPAAFVRGLAENLSRTVSLYEESPVVRLHTGSEKIVETPDGRITAPKVILANNGHVENFGFFARRLMHVFTYASMTRRLDAEELKRLRGADRWGLIPADPMGTTVRRIKEGRIVIRNTFTYNPQMSTTADQIARIGQRHDRSFIARFPMLKDVGMEYRWGGHLCLSLNSAGAFGEIEDGVYAACCCNGLGTVKSTLHGMLIAELAAGNYGHDVQALCDEMPDRLYPEPIMTLGAHGKLCWMQARAGREL
jgi:glycine/D-amino acid oxidase-like deaminating enzyme